MKIEIDRLPRRVFELGIHVCRLEWFTISLITFKISVYTNHVWDVLNADYSDE